MDQAHPQQERYSIEQLANYIQLMIHLTGEPPTTLEVSADFYTWYVQTVNKTVENLGGKLNGDGQMIFQNIKLEKKQPKIVTTPTPSTTP